MVRGPPASVYETRIVVPSSAVPLRVGAASEVMPSPGTPVSLPKPAMTGAPGAAVSRVTVLPVRTTSLPAASRIVICAETASEKPERSAREVPSAPTVYDTTWSASRKVTVALAPASSPLTW